jgi:hypothetical protein
MFDNKNNRIGFYIWNEADIPSVVIGPSITLGYLEDSGNNIPLYFTKGSVSLNYVLLSTL